MLCIQLIGKHNRSVNQITRDAGRICENTPGIEIGLTDQEPPENRTADKHQRQDTDD